MQHRNRARSGWARRRRAIEALERRVLLSTDALPWTESLTSAVLPPLIGPVPVTTQPQITSIDWHGETAQAETGRWIVELDS